MNMTKQVKMDQIQLNELLDIRDEHQKNAREYEALSKTGNTQGEHKEFYRGKSEAYKRGAVLINRFLRWNEYIED